MGAGGSFVMSQQWVHSLAVFHQLSDSEQELVIGRTKPDSVELDDERMPENCHVSRSVPYGGVQQHGLYCLAFSCDIARFDHISTSMFGLGAFTTI